MSTEPAYKKLLFQKAVIAIAEQQDEWVQLSFARRNVFCGNRLYQNKYEMNEWVQEARIKGMSNPREIWRYARQKETALHGV